MPMQDNATPTLNKVFKNIQQEFFRYCQNQFTLITLVSAGILLGAEDNSRPEHDTTLALSIHTAALTIAVSHSAYQLFKLQLNHGPLSANLAKQFYNTLRASHEQLRPLFINIGATVGYLLMFTFRYPNFIIAAAGVLGAALLTAMQTLSLGLAHGIIGLRIAALPIQIRAEILRQQFAAVNEYRREAMQQVAQQAAHVFLNLAHRWRNEPASNAAAAA